MMTYVAVIRLSIISIISLVDMTTIIYYMFLSLAKEDQLVMQSAVIV